MLFCRIINDHTLKLLTFPCKNIYKRYVKYFNNINSIVSVHLNNISYFVMIEQFLQKLGPRKSKKTHIKVSHPDAGYPHNSF